MTAVETHELHHDDHPGETHPHAPDSFYFKVAGVLAIMTAVEVALSYAGLEGVWLLLPLAVLMVMKFAVVAALFMHLKGDNRLFTRLFASGIALAIFVYIIALSTFHVFAG